MLSAGGAAGSGAEADAWPRAWRQSGLLEHLRAAGAIHADRLVEVSRGRVDTLRLEDGHALDDAGLHQQLKETGVLGTKVYRDWDWWRIEALLDGPLRHEPKLERLMRASPKWVKRQPPCSGRRRIASRRSTRGMASRRSSAASPPSSSSSSPRPTTARSTSPPTSWARSPPRLRNTYSRRASLRAAAAEAEAGRAARAASQIDQAAGGTKAASPFTRQGSRGIFQLPRRKTEERPGEQPGGGAAAGRLR